MNKILLITVLLILNIGACAYAVSAPSTMQYHQKIQRDEIKKEFEQRLNLTDKQKQKAKEIHKSGQEEMKPVIVQIELKRQEIETVKLSRMAVRAQEEKIAQITAEINNLEKQAREIRKKNSQEFEKILNKKQKEELAKMKAEGRARYEQYHKQHTPFQGLGTPSFLLRPLLPPAK